MLNSKLHKIKRIPKTCQQENKLSSVQPIQPVLNDPVAHLYALRPSEKKLLNELMWSHAFFEKGEYRAQQTLANKTQYKTRKTIIRAEKRLEEFGFIEVIRHHCKTNIIKLSSWFKDSFLRKTFSRFFSNISYVMLTLPFGLLLSLEASCKENVPQSNLSNILKNSLYKVTTQIRATAMSEIHKNKKITHNEVMFASATTNTNLLFKEKCLIMHILTTKDLSEKNKKQKLSSGSISQKYNPIKSPQREVQWKPSYHKLFVDTEIKRTEQEKLHEANKIDALLNSDQYKSFAQLFGPKIARSFLERASSNMRI